MSRKTETLENKPVIDAKRPLTIRISKRDISGASTKDPEMCVAARAIRRQCNVLEAKVHLGRVYVRANEGNWQRYVTPRPLRDELIAFDRGGTFESGEYTLLPPFKSQRLKKKPTGPKKKPGKKRRHYHAVKNVRPVA